MNTIAIDCGASFVKGGLIVDGTLVQEIKKSSPVVADDIFTPNQVNSLTSIVKNVFDELSQNLSDVYFTISNEMHGFILCDATGLPVTDYVSWQKELGNIPFGENKETALRILSKEKYQKHICNTGMPTRSGLPNCNLIYILNSEKKRFNNTKIKFFTLGDYLVFRLFNVVMEIHPTNAAATGLYDLKSGSWNKELIDAAGEFDIVFQKVGEKEVIVNLGEKKVHIFPSIGDQQAALLGADLHDEKGISFNLGTGAQVSVCTSVLEFDEKYQLRPYFNHLFLKTIPHIPSGRALNVYIRFVKSVLQMYDIAPDDGDLWNKLLNMLDDDVFDSELKCDLSFFDNTVTKYDKGSINNIGEFDLDVRKLFKSVLTQCATNFISVSERLVSDESKYEYLVFSGGIAQKIDYIRNKIIDKYSAINNIIVAKNETLFGIDKYINMIRG